MNDYTQSEKPKSAKPKPTQSLRSRALAIVSRREVSRLELQRKLAPFAENPDELEQVLNEFAERAWQSDERFTEMWIHSKSPKKGNLRLRQELMAKGVETDLIEQYLPDDESELNHAIEVLKKKFRQPANDFSEKQRQMRFLLYRGFEMDTVQKALKLAWLSENDQQNY